MRRILCLCLSVVLLFLSAGCGQEEEAVKLPVMDEATRISIEAEWLWYQYENDYKIFPHWYTELTRSGLDGVRYYGGRQDPSLRKKTAGRSVPSGRYD